MLRIKSKVIILTAIAACMAAPAIVHAIPFSSINQVYFFGDDTTDSGYANFANAAGPNPTKAPIFSTYAGNVWAQYVARDIKGFTIPTAFPVPIAGPDTITNNTTPTNGSSGGATTNSLTGVDYAALFSTTNSTSLGITWAPSLTQQVAQYLSTAPATLDPNNVYFIWSGMNDILAVATQVPPPTQLQLLQAANTAAINIGNEVATLAARGARRFVILSMPNLGIFPISTGSPSTASTLKNISFTFNSMLNSQLGRVIKATGVKVLYVDTYTLIGNIVTATNAGQPYVINEQVFQFVNDTLPACGAASGASLSCSSSAPTNYVFSDTTHVTDMTHRIISLQVENLIQSWT